MPQLTKYWCLVLCMDDPEIENQKTVDSTGQKILGEIAQGKDECLNTVILIEMQASLSLIQWVNSSTVNFSN